MITLVDCGYSVFDSTPTTYVISSSMDSVEYLQMKNRFSEIANSNYTHERTPEKHCKNNIWIVKPANLNQGKGIEIFSDLT
jgi:hypothetical protein